MTANDEHIQKLSDAKLEQVSGGSTVQLGGYTCPNCNCGTFTVLELRTAPGTVVYKVMCRDCLHALNISDEELLRVYTPRNF